MMDSIPLQKLTSCLGFSRRLALKQNMRVVVQYVDTALLSLRFGMLVEQSRSSEPTCRQIIRLSDLLQPEVQTHRSAAPAPRDIRDEAAQTDDELSLLSGFVSDAITRTVTAQIQPLMDLLRQPQEESAANTERCRQLEARQAQVQAQVGQLETKCEKPAMAASSQSSHENRPAHRRIVDASHLTNQHTCDGRLRSSFAPGLSDAKQQRREARQRELEGKLRSDNSC
eukprot:Skav230171  [mRNA]  locus=scaffold196:28163:28843:- [translate_table: standard]